MSLIQQSADIASLGHTLYAHNDEPCPRCTAMFACWLHKPELIRTRRMTRGAWWTEQHMRRLRRWESEQQARDIENFRETHGYEMPYSIAHSLGYAE